ncbi:MAG: hypothetical protein ACM3PE_07910 [Deltaproteobacteria bacterium]
MIISSLNLNLTVTKSDIFTTDSATEIAEASSNISEQITGDVYTRSITATLPVTNKPLPSLNTPTDSSGASAEEIEDRVKSLSQGQLAHQATAREAYETAKTQLKYPEVKILMSCGQNLDINFPILR